jgi:hypothetical protein
MCCPEARSHRHIDAISAISPIPQLRDDGIEKRGTRIPARRVDDPLIS